MTVLRPAIAIALALCAATAGAQPAPGALPPLQQQGDARYVCGGIGSDESTALRAAMREHPLSLLFARAGGDYLADVQVAVRPADGGAGASLAFTAKGPVCLLDLPRGRYAVEAASGGATQRRTIEVDGTPRTADFRF